MLFLAERIQLSRTQGGSMQLLLYHITTAPPLHGARAEGGHPLGSPSTGCLANPILCQVWKTRRELTLLNPHSSSVKQLP